MTQPNATSRWGHRALNMALLALGVTAVALLYALVSQSLSSGNTRLAPSSAANPSATEASSGPTADMIQVGVRNGCGQPGLAARARDYLVRAGFDVVEVGNYSSFDLDSSLVIDRVGDRAAARRLARALGIPEQRIRQDVNARYHLDASVILGSDYSTLKPFQDASK